MTVTALDLRMNLKKLVSLSQRFRTLTHSLAQPGPVACLARFVLPGCLLISKSGSDVGSDAQSLRLSLRPCAACVGVARLSDRLIYEKVAVAKEFK